MELAIILLFILVGMALVLAWSIGLGWLLSHILPFSLFEGSLLAMVASVIVGYVASRILRGLDLPLIEPELALEQRVDLPSYAIPHTRFYPTETDKTWEAWFRFELANRLYDALAASPRLTGYLDKSQRQELAIRLTDVGIALLKAKTGRGRQVRTRLVDWQGHMAKQGLKPYDEALLGLAMTTLHNTLATPLFERVVRTKLWDQPARVDLADEPPPASR
jgi:hypothetical protein